MTLPRFDLAVQGYAGYVRSSLSIPKRSISRDPLMGVADGINTVFHTNYFPLLTSGSLVVREPSSGSTLSGVCDYDTGEITLTTAPNSQPVASYTFSPFTALQISSFLVNGFYEMETRWHREWQLITSGSTRADETSPQILIADANYLEPLCGASEFSDVAVQVEFLLACVEYRQGLASYGESAFTAYDFRETSKGMSVSKSKMPGNIGDYLRMLDDRLKRAMFQAQLQYYPGKSNLGGSVRPPISASYAMYHEWQTASKLYDYRGELPYHLSVRPF